MKIAVMTDSNSGIFSETGKKMGVHVVPMPVIIDGETFYEGIDLTLDSFFERLTGGSEISTSQPSPGDLLDMWDRTLKEGYDEIIYIPMSSGLSNSCSSAIMLAQDYDGKVQVADNHRISVPQYGSVRDALKLAADGKSAAQIKKALEDAAYDCSIYIAVDTLEYLKKGGRITAAAAAVGTVLHIKPILTIQGDKLDSFAKTRGTRKCRTKIIEAIRHDLTERFGKEDISKMRIATAGTFRNPEDAKRWRSEVEAAFPGFEVVYFDLGCSVAAHTGPEAFAAGIYKVLE